MEVPFFLGSHSFKYVSVRSYMSRELLPSVFSDEIDDPFEDLNHDSTLEYYKTNTLFPVRYEKIGTILKVQECLFHLFG